MIEIDNTLISEEILENDFVCNLDACKGACCVEGDAGAPVEDDEVEILERIYHKVAPYLSEQGRKAIEAQGTAVRGSDGEWETPLINGGECAYVVRDEKGIVLCGIEQAYREGKIDWKKPISCHLYPIRITEYSNFSAINYHEWDICSDACTLGKELGVKVYQFLKKPLIRKYGEEFYQTLSEAAEEWEKEFGKG